MLAEQAVGLRDGHSGKNIWIPQKIPLRLAFDMSYVGSRVKGSNLFTTYQHTLEMSVYKVPVKDAIRATGPTCIAIGLYQRLARLQDQNACIDEADAREFDLQCKAAEGEHATVCAQEAETDSSAPQANVATPTPSASVSNIASSSANSKITLSFSNLPT